MGMYFEHECLGCGYGVMFKKRSLEVDAKIEYAKAGGGTQARMKSEVKKITMEALVNRGYSKAESEMMIEKLEQ